MNDHSSLTELRITINRVRVAARQKRCACKIAGADDFSNFEDRGVAFNKIFGNLNEN